MVGSDQGHRFETSPPEASVHPWPPRRIRGGCQVPRGRGEVPSHRPCPAPRLCVRRMKARGVHDQIADRDRNNRPAALPSVDETRPASPEPSQRAHNEEVGHPQLGHRGAPFDPKAPSRPAPEPALARCRRRGPTDRPTTWAQPRALAPKPLQNGPAGSSRRARRGRPPTAPRAWFMQKHPIGRPKVSGAQGRAGTSPLRTV